jgi:bacterial/archaeal transporter family-2 protein
MDALGVPTLLLAGGLLAFQAAANVQLSAALGSPFGASTLQLGLGATVLVSAAAAALSLSALARVDRMPAWHLLGGLGSSLYITAGILLVPRLGAVVSFGLFIAGQMLASLLVDGTGWLDLPAKGIHPAGVAGAVAVLAGAGLVVRGATRAGAGRRSGAVALAAWLVLALAAGAGLPVRGQSTRGCEPTSTHRSPPPRSRSSWRRRRWRSCSSPRSRSGGRRPRGRRGCARCPGGAGWAAPAAPST